MNNKNKHQPDKQIKVPPEVHQLVKVTAAKEGTEMREFVTKAINFYLKYRGSDEKSKS
ncbi:hypothetical protein [Paraliobacillus ryukyuensis]|uniref:hypothetical protein n=1 Tax=Paraliobacillus ryukyuensis TaxID=200904 RepID=UPI0015C4452E|nr:hypothetical protein [Paraliobacillus ryukyuensis]